MDYQGFIMSLFENHFAIKDIKYIDYWISNGFVFLAEHYFTSVCYKYITISKFLLVTYITHNYFRMKLNADDPLITTIKVNSLNNSTI